MTTSAEPGTRSGTATYVYGIVPSSFSAQGPPAGVARNVALVDAEGIAALVSEVPAGEFSEEALAARLQDLEWVEAQARAHESVLEWALETGPVVPFRLCTVYGSETQLHEFVSANAPELEALLERLRGTVERGVKAFVDPQRLEAWLQGGDERESAASSAGREYMLRRQRERELTHELDRVRRTWAAHAHARLRDAAREATVLDLQPRELTGRPDEMLLNGAYLVGTSDRGFSAAVEALADDARPLGVTIEGTGPWPPYNFVPRELGTP